MKKKSHCTRSSFGSKADLFTLMLMACDVLLVDMFLVSGERAEMNNHPLTFPSHFLLTSLYVHITTRLCYEWYFFHLCEKFPQ